LRVGKIATTDRRINVAKIRHQAERVRVELWRLEFDYLASPGSGFSFDCDRNGRIDYTKLCYEAQQNLDKCIHGEYPVDKGRIVDISYTYRQAAILECNCGEVIDLEDVLTNECPKCGRLYSGSGESLAPIEQWDPEDKYACFGPQNGPDEY
jgi:hypothetical protein